MTSKSIHAFTKYPGIPQTLTEIEQSAAPSFSLPGDANARAYEKARIKPIITALWKEPDFHLVRGIIAAGIWHGIQKRVIQVGSVQVPWPRLSRDELIGIALAVASPGQPHSLIRHTAQDEVRILEPSDVPEIVQHTRPMVAHLAKVVTFRINDISDSFPVVCALLWPARDLNQLLKAIPVVPGISYAPAADSFEERRMPTELRPYTDRFRELIAALCPPGDNVEWVPFGPPPGENKTCPDFESKAQEATASWKASKKLTEASLAKSMWISKSTVEREARALGGWAKLKTRLNEHRRIVHSQPSRTS